METMKIVHEYRWYKIREKDLGTYVEKTPKVCVALFSTAQQIADFSDS